MTLCAGMMTDSSVPLSSSPLLPLHSPTSDPCRSPLTPRLRSPTPAVHSTPLSLFTAGAEVPPPASVPHFLPELQNWPSALQPHNPTTTSEVGQSLTLFGLQVTCFFVFSKTWPPKIQAYLQTGNFRKERMKEGNPEPRARTPGTVEAFSLLEEFIQAPLLRLLSEGLSPAVTQRGDCGLRG